jgi:hypothetical protein
VLQFKSLSFGLIFIVIVFSGCFAQNSYRLDKPAVDKRVELLSIVFRLAGNDEYNRDHFKRYTDRIDRHFTPYRNHELIRFAKKMAEERGVNFDAVMFMAVHIDENLNPLVKFTDRIPEPRWDKKNADKFVKLLKQFYIDARCRQFFESNDSLYAEIGKRFLPVYESLDVNWYGSFYGREPTETFVIVNAPAAGGNNYGPSVNLPDGERKVYAIMGIWEVDDSGMAIFRKDAYLFTLVHEFNHSFVNSLIEKNEEAFKNNGERIFDQVKEKMYPQHYGNWKTVLYEALVRAAEIKYMLDHHFDRGIIQNVIRGEVEKGFLWIEKLVGELQKYSDNRTVYPTLERYMPELIKAYDGYANFVEKYEENIPHVVSINEFTNGDTDVSAGIKTITVNFDKPLAGKGYSIFLGNKGKDAFPKMGGITYSDDKKSVIMEVSLEKEKEYQLIMKGWNFKTADGIGIADYEINFQTK